MGNAPPSKDIIPMPDEKLYLSLLQEGFIIAEHVFDYEQQNGVRITISNSDRIPELKTQKDDLDEENGMVYCKMPDNYGLFKDIWLKHRKSYYLCDKDGESIAYVFWQDDINGLKKIISINKIKKKVDLTGFELINNEFKRVYPNSKNKLKIYNKTRSEAEIKRSRQEAHIEYLIDYTK